MHIYDFLGAFQKSPTFWGPDPLQYGGLGAIPKVFNVALHPIIFSEKNGSA